MSLGNWETHLDACPYKLCHFLHQRVMNPHHGRAAARPIAPITSAILADRAWIARRIRNNCLRQHCHALVKSLRHPHFPVLRPACARLLNKLETESRILFELHPTEFAVIPAVMRLCAYEAMWLRKPEEWQPNPNDEALEQWADLLRHLLAQFPVPGFLDAAWQIKGTLNHFERDCWCALGYGRSVKKVAGFPESVSSRVLHLALTSGEGLSLTSAIWHAQLKYLDATPALQSAVMASRVPHELSNHALWVRVIAKFAAGANDMSGQFALVADTLTAIKAHRGSDQVEQLLRLPLPSLIRHGIRFVTQLLQANGHLLTEDQVRHSAERAELSRLAAASWVPMLGSVRLLGAWSVEELCNLDALKAEGRAMNHCVAGYAHRCKSGTSAIFSLRNHLTDAEGVTQGKSYATIEVHPRTRQVVQVRAFRNKPASNSIMNKIQEWAAMRGLN